MVYSVTLITGELATGKSTIAQSLLASFPADLNGVIIEDGMNSAVHKGTVDRLLSPIGKEVHAVILVGSSVALLDRFPNVNVYRIRCERTLR